jgi:hypothetical protein
MRLELEWHIPWPSDWDQAKKDKAAAKLVEYMTTGTLFETQRRMRATEARVMTFSNRDPYLALVLES